MDVEICRALGGAVRIIACMEDPVVVQKILSPVDCAIGLQRDTVRRGIVTHGDRKSWHRAGVLSYKAPASI